MKHKNKIWMLGFLGFLGFQFFQTKHYGDLIFFSFFSNFAYFFIDKISATIPDERYVENMYKAKSKIFPLVIYLMFFIACGIAFNILNKFTTIILLCVGYSLAIILYTIAFYYFEKN